jgi:hypothetical protein
VCETFERRRNGDRIPCFSVHYRLGGKIYNKRFDWHWYPNRREALKDAAQFRAEMEQAMMKAWQQKKRQQARQKRTTSKAAAK